MSEIKTVGVVGAGTMGNGIAHVFARSGYRVVLCEVERRFLDHGLETIRRNLEREATKGKITPEDVDDALRLIEGTLDRDSLGECDFIVEAATERFEIKSEIFRDLDRIARPETRPNWRRTCAPFRIPISGNYAPMLLKN